MTAEPFPMSTPAAATQWNEARAGFFDKIIAFFKKLFGLSKIFPQVYKNVF